MKSLKEYQRKRTPAKTPEPMPAPASTRRKRHLVFVVQKHAARRLHYDLRLEMRGVLKSFAVPKGPSLDPSVKRLAVKVEDHPFDYKDFEGVIPRGNYGAGSVIIWDRGFYGSSLTSDPAKGEVLLMRGLRDGSLKFTLAGTKLKGEFALVKIQGDDTSWLLIKHKDRYATAADILQQDRSVTSGTTIDELSGDAAIEKKNAGTVDGTSAAAIIAGVPRKKLPRPVQPMQPTAAKTPFNHPDWIFEIKWDGYRAIAELDNKNVALYSRNRLPLTRKYAPVTEALARLGLDAVLDGEIIVADKKGAADFQKLQHYSATDGANLIYYVFDILSYQDRSLIDVPLVQRKILLRKILPDGAHVKFSSHIWKDGESFFAAAQQNGIEGVVAKHSQSRYLPGARSDQWLKIKMRVTQDCVIAGFTLPRGSRKYIGSLVLGAFEKGKLVYIGHSGGGFDAAALKAMHEALLPLTIKICPFETVPPQDTPVTWIKPGLVCEVAFAGWTSDKVMRQPRFMRMRDDLDIRDAVLSKGTQE